MQIQHLAYLKEIEHMRSITQAADNLFISRQALSKIVKQLESELGFQVFTRSNQGIIPTAKGLQLLKDLDIILPIAKSWKALADTEKCEKTKIKLLLQNILKYSILDPFLLSALKSVENIDIEWETEPLPNILRKIKNDSEAIGIMVTTSNSPFFLEMQEIAKRNLLNLEKISEAQLFIILRKDDVLSTKEHICLQDLNNREMVRTKSVDKSQLAGSILKYTGRNGHIIPETVDILGYMLNTENSFTVSFEKNIKNNPYIQKGDFVIKHLETCMLENIFIMYNEQIYEKNHPIIQILRKYY